ncbi:SDR family oxidoreductase [Undibacterium luofuense]|uniref:SDR family oxidoreductase n=1 Tax=Undibacterium luofuense TaxID=2828733 RepID=A0A941DGX4_9BURK|nr:SDR family oxidoreductase [Undibacterium luofuense]MBR7780513.1 SDR family oxidoreductase [Undibacterium luofuense]
MRILICGADGMVGHALSTALAQAGHQIVRGVRRPRLDSDRLTDFRAQHSPEQWRTLVQGCDVVINAVGILREQQSGDFSAIHTDAPQALFLAAAQQGVQQIIQISALGADLGGTAYFRSKLAADRYLLEYLAPAFPQLRCTVLRPSLIFSAQGASSQLLMGLASLPVLVVPHLPDAGLQPLHIDDLCTAVVQLCGSEQVPAIAELAGPERKTVESLLLAYRALLGQAPAPVIRLPAGLAAAGAWCAQWLPSSALTPDSWQMLQQGSATERNALPALCKRPLRRVSDFLPVATVSAVAAQVREKSVLGIHRIVLAMIWLITAGLSAGLTPLEDSLALLSPLGLSGNSAVLALFAAALLDAGFGLATLLRPGKRLWRMQAGLIVFYSIVIGLFLPAFWLHPFGPVLKNLAVLSLLLHLHMAEPS